MGLFSALFSRKEKNHSEGRDGIWLSGERNSSWREIGEFAADQPVEFSPESCYTMGGATSVVLRSHCRGEQQYVMYIGCLIAPNKIDEIVVLVDRYESSSGAVLVADRWSHDRLLSVTTLSWVSDLIVTARNQAKINNYSTEPPFALFVMNMKV